MTGDDGFFLGVDVGTSATRVSWCARTEPPWRKGALWRVMLWRPMLWSPSRCHPRDWAPRNRGPIPLMAEFWSSVMGGHPR